MPLPYINEIGQAVRTAGGRLPATWLEGKKRMVVLYAAHLIWEVAYSRFLFAVFLG
jgi:hypothetical protein